MGTKAIDTAAIAADEATLARAAAAGDGSAFASLYERYEQRAFNLAYRMAGSEADAADIVKEAFLKVLHDEPRIAEEELPFGLRLFTELRHACHAPVAGSQATAPGQVEGEGVQAASMRLPERQREALALRELEQLPHGEIGAILEVSGDAVAQLLSRARINLADELHGTALASVAPSHECERALLLIARRDDGQLEGASRDALWLEAHLESCERCRKAAEAMHEASVSYREWAPIAAVPWLFQETMAKAADLLGVDWSTEISRATADRSPPTVAMQPAGSRASSESAGSASRSTHSRRRLAGIAAGLVALLLLSGLAMALNRNDRPAATAEPATRTAVGEAQAVASADELRSTGEKKKSGKSGKAAADTADTSFEDTASTPIAVPAEEPVGGGGQSGHQGGSPSKPSGTAGVEVPQQTTAPKTTSKPKATSAPAPAPTPVTSPAPVAEPAPAEETVEEPPRRREPPGRPADRPPR